MSRAQRAVCLKGKGLGQPDRVVGLKREHGKKNGRWLVDYWQPNWRPPIPMAVH